MDYIISYQNPTSQYIPIEAKFNVTEDNFVELQFPTWRPGRYERGDFVKNVHGFKVMDENNKKLDSFKVKKDRWKVDCSTTQTITVKYKYYAAELNAGSSFMDEVQLYVNPVNCLIYIDSKQGDPCRVTLDIPDSFEIACGQQFEGKVASFETYHELVDSPFIASANMTHLMFNCKSIDYHLWFQGDVKLDDKKIIQDFKQFTFSQLEKFGSFPVNEYHYLFQIHATKAYHGVEHCKSTVISLGPTYDLMNKLYDDLLGVSSHELYHTWNVKALRPTEMYPYDYSQENYSRQGYVTEGVTTYMGDLFLAESGVKNWNWYKAELEKLLQKHFDNFGRFNYSVAESSFDTWLDGYVAGAPNRKVSIYNEGALLSLVLDAKIRTNSSNKASMHNVMKELYDNFAVKNKGYTERDFQGAVEKYADENLTDFFSKFYYGTDPYESILTEALAQLGLQIKMIKNPLASVDVLGIKCSQQGGKTSVSSLYPGSSADLGGIILKDEIVSINGFRVNNDLDNWTTYFKEDQIDLVICRQGKMMDIMCPNTNKSYFPLYKIEKVKVPSNLQKRVFKKWCGSNWDENLNS
jgi:predicted metalloprotease with PDZ domain